LPRLSVIGTAVLLAGMIAATQTTISIEHHGESFKVIGWKAPHTAPAKGWGSIFAVYAGEGNVPALLGSYAVESEALVFHPAFPVASGVRYRAIFRPPAGGAPIERVFEESSKDANRKARVENVYPSTDVWPANQLRVYIYFSAPMSRGEAARRIRLLDEKGNDVRGAFLPGQELWDPKFQRLTMTFDPGRIKRGLTSNQTMGLAIVEGRLYRLTIDGGWPDARGVPMIEGFSKSFRGGPMDRNPPDPKYWRLRPPQAATKDSLTVDFPEPMNYPLLHRMLRVSSGRANVAGTVQVEHQETRWRFTPNEPWRPGDYQLVVNTAIEDLAGNHIGEAFDIDVFERVAEHVTSSTVSLPFTVREQPTAPIKH